MGAKLLVVATQKGDISTNWHSLFHKQIEARSLAIYLLATPTEEGGVQVPL